MKHLFLFTALPLLSIPSAVWWAMSWGALLGVAIALSGFYWWEKRKKAASPHAMQEHEARTVTERSRSEATLLQRKTEEKRQREEAERLARQKAEHERQEHEARVVAERSRSEAALRQRQAEEKRQQEESERLARLKAEHERQEREARAVAERSRSEAALRQRQAEEKRQREDSEQLARLKAEQELQERSRAVSPPLHETAGRMERGPGGEVNTQPTDPKRLLLERQARLDQEAKERNEKATQERLARNQAQAEQDEKEKAALEQARQAAKDRLIQDLREKAAALQKEKDEAAEPVLAILYGTPESGKSRFWIPDLSPYPSEEAYFQLIVKQSHAIVGLSNSHTLGARLRILGGDNIRTAYLLPVCHEQPGRKGAELVMVTQGRCEQDGDFWVVTNKIQIICH